jgi:hypothetical protein
VIQQYFPDISTSTIADHLKQMLGMAVLTYGTEIYRNIAGSEIGTRCAFGSAFTVFQINQKQRNCSRCHSGNSRCLTNGFGPGALQFFSEFG